ncbi:hypothetical protein [Paenibacillus zanthoxyli]|uniref:hypothetical protein n=1 Tax=Paenibacillus zanthoxyli TaxID=369399 RepID=UPI000472B4C6|nr:hypothetical protein [Paenibacillus zanthoxyli]
MSIVLSSARMAGKNYNLQSARKPASYAERVRVNARHIIRNRGVSAILAFWAQELEKRPSEDQMSCWRALLPMAQSIVWEEYVRYGETLDVWTNLDDGEGEISPPFEPIIYAQVLTGSGGYAEWHKDPIRNELRCWNREVRG